MQGPCTPWPAAALTWHTAGLHMQLDIRRQRDVVPCLLSYSCAHCFAAPAATLLKSWCSDGSGLNTLQRSQQCEAAVAGLIQLQAERQRVLICSAEPESCEQLHRHVAIERCQHDGIQVRHHCKQGPMACLASITWCLPRDAMASICCCTSSSAHPQPFSDMFCQAWHTAQSSPCAMLRYL